MASDPSLGWPGESNSFPDLQVDESSASSRPSSPDSLNYGQNMFGNNNPYTTLSDFDLDQFQPDVDTEASPDADQNSCGSGANSTAVDTDTALPANEPPMSGPSSNPTEATVELTTVKPTVVEPAVTDPVEPKCEQAPSSFDLVNLAMEALKATASPFGNVHSSPPQNPSNISHCFSSQTNEANDNVNIGVAEANLTSSCCDSHNAPPPHSFSNAQSLPPQIPLTNAYGLPPQMPLGNAYSSLPQSNNANNRFNIKLAKDDLTYATVEEGIAAAAERVELCIANDNWSEVRKNQAGWVKAILSIFDDDIVAERPPKDFESLEHLEYFQRWQENSLNSTQGLLQRKAKDDPNLAEKRVWMLFAEVLHLHQYGVRTLNPAEPLKIDDTLMCSQRLELIMRKMRQYAIIRADVLGGQRLYDLTVNPSTFVKRKVANVKANWGKKVDKAKRKPAVEHSAGVNMETHANAHPAASSSMLPGSSHKRHLSNTAEMPPAKHFRGSL